MPTADSRCWYAFAICADAVTLSLSQQLLEMTHHVGLLVGTHVGAKLIDGLRESLLGLCAHLCLAGTYSGSQFVLGQQCPVEISVAHFES